MSFISLQKRNTMIFLLVDLSEGLSSEVLHPILSNPEFMRQLRDFLPPTDQAERDTPAMVRDTVQSPQFAQVFRDSPDSPLRLRI